MNKKRIALMGATGSIGASALSAVALYSDRFEIVTMAAGSNLEAFLPICATVRPKVVAVKSKEHAEILRRELPGIAVGFGPQGLIDVATHPDVDVVLGGLVGSVGLVPAYEAVKAGKTLALANKETLVVAGEPLMRKARETGAAVLPVDSEHCALHQALRAGAAHEVQRLVLTASGGPFRTRPIETFAEITIQDALAHPTWKMGPKITIDSATMMNKGLEVIEARWLFDVVPGKIDVLVHPQSIVHSLVEYVDGSFLAQMSPNDMRFPILYALSYPDRLPTPMPRLDLGALARLDFAPLDPVRYPALPLTYAALREGGTAPAALNAANEVAVQAFLDGRLSYNAIVELVGQILVRHTVRPVDTVEDALEADRWARAEAAALVPTFEKRLRVAVPAASLSRNL